MRQPEGFERELGPGGLETRMLPLSDTVLRAANSGSGDPVIEGYGSVYNQTTTIAGWFDEWDEEVVSGAWAKTIQAGDIRSMMNHDVNQLLGRTMSDTLQLEDRNNGLWYSITVNGDDPNAMSSYAKVAQIGRAHV